MPRPMEAETMKKLKPITLPELFREFTGPVIAAAVEVDKSLPCKWAKGHLPTRENERKLAEFAKSKGYALKIGGER